ncbi:MAG TPA: 2'-5' RNA ligase family protein [Marmoricola sp.]
MSTIGVSIAVPDPWGAQLQDYRVQLGDSSARQIPSHITLIPPCEVADGEIDTVVAHLERTASATAAFSVHLRGTGTFRPVSPVVFVNVVAGISECEVLADGLRQGPIEDAPRFPYHPHVTIAHELDEPLLDRAFSDLADFDCVFEVTEFHLYEHDAAEGWRPTHTVLLQ